ncbi:MAG: NAD-dependent epimerase [Chitinophagaceae bacterium]
MTFLVTGTAGFIGFHVVNRLLQDGHTVLGIDNLNTYYDVSLKHNRLREVGIEAGDLQYGTFLKSQKNDAYTFVQLNLEDKFGLQATFAKFKPDIVINLAAQAGVRYSLKNPDAYVSSNIMGFMNILECCRHNEIKHFVYASSSSVYGLNGHEVFSTSHHTDHPVSLYAATKKSNEMMAHTYSHLFRMPATGLRFFTVYGPWGRPDMALFLFTKAIFNNTPIDVFNNGEMYRDFTYIDDIVEGVVKVAYEAPPSANAAWASKDPDPSISSAPYRLYNIGNNQAVKLTDFIKAIEEATGKAAIKVMKPLQAGDVISTYANVDGLRLDYGYQPKISVKEGVSRFVEWFRAYYKI